MTHNDVIDLTLCHFKIYSVDLPMISVLWPMEDAPALFGCFVGSMFLL